MSYTVYNFISPLSKDQTIEAIQNVMLLLGSIKKVDSVQGYIVSKFKVSAIRKEKFEFFIENSDTNCKVRMRTNASALDKFLDRWWDIFINKLFELYPNVDFNVTCANDNPLIAAVLFLGSETNEVHISKTSSGTSLGGFLIGGALFGGVGAAVGGMSGTKHTVGFSNQTFSNTQLVRLIYNNGRIFEGEVRKNSKLYNQIMVNL